MVNPILAKIVSMVVLGFCALFFGLLPIKLKDYFQKLERGDPKKKNIFDVLISMISCFGAGVILTTCLLHMIPDANEELVSGIQKGHMIKSGFPIVEILFVSGFFLIYIVEEVTVLLSHKWRTRESKELTNDNNENLHCHGTEFEVIQESSNHFSAILRSFIIIIALGLHSIFEGIAIGLGRKTSQVWFLFFAIASHKFVVAFVIGMQFVISGLSNKRIIFMISTFSSISPLGILIGILLTMAETDSESPARAAAITVLNGLAAGTLLYVVFFEILEKERAKHKYGIIQVFSMICGFLFMILVGILDTSAEDDASYCDMDISSFTSEQKFNFTCNNCMLNFV